MKVLHLSALFAGSLALSAAPADARHPQTVPGLAQAIQVEAVKAAYALKPFAQLGEARLLHRDLFQIYANARQLGVGCARRNVAAIVTSLERATAVAERSHRRFDAAVTRATFPSLDGPAFGPALNPAATSKCVCKHLDRIGEMVECLHNLVHEPVGPAFPGLDDFQPQPGPVIPQPHVRPQPPAIVPVQPLRPAVLIPQPRRGMTFRKGRFAIRLNF